MPSIVLDGTGPSKSSLVEGGYDFCGLSGDQYERTPEEMSKGLRLLNDIMASLKSYDGIDLGFDFPAYGEGLLEEPSGISLAARRPVCALLAQTLAPTIGATLTPEANAVLSTAMQSLRAFSTVAPPSRVPSSRMRTLHRLRRICGCTSPSVAPTTPTPVPVTPPAPAPPTTFLPANSVLPAITGTASVGNVLTCSQGTWTNGPTSFVFQWLRGSSPISGANASTYTLAIADAEQAISCIVTALNAGGSAAATSNSVTIAPIVAPAVSVAPVISGTPQQGQTLSTTNGTWLHQPTGYAYQWNRSGAPISGAASATYVLASADVGATITCTVTATNTIGSTPSTSNSLGPVIALAPVNSVAPAVTGTTVVGSTLSVTNGTWLNSPVSYAYQWKRNGAAISGATSATYVLASADVGTNISCDVTATNTGGSSTVGSNSVGPISAAPTLAAPVLTETSTTGTNPPTWDTTAANLQDGDTVELYYTTNGTTPTATGSPQGSVTFDARTETINWGSAWPSSFPDGTVVKWAERYGRVIGGSMVWSPLSNVLSDTMPVSSTPDFVASSAQPAAVGAGGTNTVTFTGIDFQAGRYVVFIAPTSPLATAVTANGVSLTNILSAVDSFSGIWISSAVQLAAPSCNVVVTLASTTSNGVGIMPGTLKNVSSATPSSTARTGVWASYPNPVTTTSALTIPTGGVAVAFGALTGGPPLTANNGTQLVNTGLVGFSNAGANGVMSKNLTAGPWTPSMSASLQNFANILAAAWGP